MFCCKKTRKGAEIKKIIKFPSDGFPRPTDCTTEPDVAPSASTYEESECKDGKKFGERNYKNGDVYRGYWLDGLRHGKGMLIKNSGDSYEGDWKMGVRNGYGIERFANGTVYMGNFVNGKRYGYGEIQMGDNTIYEGTFDDEITGYGVIIWPSGDKYIGRVVNGECHGYGAKIIKGERIEGYYKKGHLAR